MLQPLRCSPRVLPLRKRIFGATLERERATVNNPTFLAMSSPRAWWFVPGDSAPFLQVMWESGFSSISLVPEGLRNGDPSKRNLRLIRYHHKLTHMIFFNHGWRGHCTIFFSPVSVERIGKRKGPFMWEIITGFWICASAASRPT